MAAIFSQVKSRLCATNKPQAPGSNIRAAGHALRKHRRLDLNPALTSKNCHARKHQEDFHLSFQNFSGKSETMPCTPQDTNFSISRTSFTVHT